MSANSNNSFSQSPDNFQPEVIQLNEVFKNIKWIGTGSFGRVYSARYTGNNKKVALKLIQFQTDFDIESVIQDMCMVKNIRSPYIVKVLETLIVELSGDKYICIVMEKYDSDLASYIDAELYGNTEFNLKRMFDMALAVRECTTRNVIHSDIKPENFLVRNDRTVLADFGLAQPNACSSGTLLPRVYTYPYRPPEVFFHVGYNLKADIWALACSYYRLLTDEYLFMTSETTQENFPYYIFLQRGNPEEEFPEITNSDLGTRVGRKVVNLYEYTQKMRDKSKQKWQRQDVFPEDTDISNLLDGMLRINPKDRFNINEVLNHSVFSKFRSSLYKDDLGCMALTMQNLDKGVYDKLKDKVENKVMFRNRNSFVRHTYETYFNNTEDYQHDMAFYLLSLVEKIVSDPQLYDSILGPETHVQLTVIASAFIQGSFDIDDYLDDFSKFKREQFWIWTIDTLTKLKCRLNFSTPYNVLMVKIRKLNYPQYKLVFIKELSVFILYLTVATYSLEFLTVEDIVEFSEDVVNKKEKRHLNKFNRLNSRVIKLKQLHDNFQNVYEFCYLFDDAAPEEERLYLSDKESYEEVMEILAK